MKRLALVAALGLAACTTAQLQTAQSAAQKLQTDVTIACNVFTPAVAPWAPFFVGNPAITAFNTDAAIVCAGNGALNFTSLQSIVATSGSAAQEAVKLLPNLTPEQQALAASVIGALVGSLKNALTAYNASTGSALPTVPAAPVPASGATS